MLHRLFSLSHGHLPDRWQRARNGGGKTLAGILVLLLPLLSGCIQLPVNVAAELSEADGSRPNHYHLQKEGEKKTPDALRNRPTH